MSAGDTPLISGFALPTRKESRGVTRSEKQAKGGLYHHWEEATWCHAEEMEGRPTAPKLLS